MISGLMTVHHNEPENLIDDPEDFASITADYYVDKRATKYKQIQPNL